MACWHRRDWRPALARREYELLLVGCFGALLIVQLVPSTTISHYHTLQAPLLCILAAIGLAQNPWRVKPHRQWALLVAGVISVNLLHQAWVVRLYDLVDWPPTNQIELTRRVARDLHTFNLREGQLVTFSTHLALEADMRIPRGYEMAIFSYRPTWTTAEAQMRHAINNDLLTQF